MNYFDQIFFLKYLREREDLVFVCHRHPLLIIDRVIVALFVGLFLPAFFYYINSFSLQSIIPFMYFEIYAIGLYIYLIYKIFNWYNDVWLITSLGIIDVNWDVFTRHVIYIDYRDITGSEIQTPSFFDSFFHKGNIILHTIGDDDDCLLEGAEYPHDIADHIEEAVHELENKKKEKDKAPMELLLHTLTEVVREHLDGPSKYSSEEEDMVVELEKVLAKKGTIDLRSGKS